MKILLSLCLATAIAAAPASAFERVGDKKILVFAGSRLYSE